MGYACYYDVSTAWARRCWYGPQDAKVPFNERMPVNGDRIFSYGTHFEMARVLRDEKGDTTCFLINGDTASHTTSKHQSHVRGAIQGLQVPSVIIPYSALDAAGIVDYSTIQVVHRTRDTVEVKEHVYELPAGQYPPGAFVAWEPEEEQIPLEVEELYRKVDAYNLEQYDQWAEHQRYCREKGGTWWRKKHFFQKCPTALTLAEWLAEMHRLGKLGNPRMGTYYNGDVTTKRAITHYSFHVYVNGRGRRWNRSEYGITYLGDGMFEYRHQTRRHWLGESLIAATVLYTITRHCKWCRDTGRVEGPVQGRWHPPEPITAWMRSFIDPTTGEEHYRYRQFETGLIKPGYWEDLERPRCSACNGRGTWTAVRHRRTKFLSAFDRGESRRSYFFCELPPKSTAATIDEALDALKPDAVRLAEGIGRDVKRQGDIFAIPLTQIDRKQLRKAGASFVKRGPLFNTNHEATETAYLPDGTTLVRGCLYHAPQWRRPDHARVRLGDVWHVVQKNLVPTAA